MIVQAAGSNKNIYLKWSLQSDSDLARSIQEDECAQALYTASSGPTGITLRWDDENFTDNNDDKTKFKNFRIFKFATSMPAVFGLLNYEIQKKFYDLKGNSVSSPASTKSTYTVANATATEQIEDAYDNPVYTNRFYCLITSDERDAGQNYRKYNSVFTDIIQAGPVVLPNLKCETSDALFTVGTANQETFNPAVELLNPDLNQ